EDLDAGKARLDELVETGDHVGRSAVRVDAVGGIVRVRLTAPRLQVVVDALGQISLVRHRSKVDHRRRPAPDGSEGVLQWSGVRNAGHEHAGAGLDVGDGWGVALDAAGHHYRPAGVDDLARFG